MSRSKQNRFPDWIEEPPPAGSYRSIFKWGAPDQFKHPNKRLFQVMKERFNMTDADFQKPQRVGHEAVGLGQAVRLGDAVLSELRSICGAENVKTDDYARIKAGFGKSMIDLFYLRDQEPIDAPDAVVCPRNADEVRALVQLCRQHKIALTPLGAGSSVTRGVACPDGGIALDMTAHMTRVLSFSEVNETITVEPGISGPQLEAYLNTTRDQHDCIHNYTCGHFPQSFEYSTVGGWVVTRGAGQNSTYYGKIEDMVIAQTYVTPTGDIKTHAIPRKSTGPDLDQIMIGSEGAFGILVAVTLRVRRYDPSQTERFSFLFKDWESATEAVREVMQAGCGFPSVFRLSDAEETDLALKLYGIEGTLIDTYLKLRGYKPGKRCLLIGSADGDGDFTNLVAHKTKCICRQYGGASATGFVTRRWEHGRFRDPYMREDLMDFGVVIDTLECAMNWENLPHVHKTVREYVHSRPDTICMAHISHMYPQGANLYFIFIARMSDRKEFIEYHRGILDAIQRSGAAMSHHHGIGKLMAPWIQAQLGKREFEVLRTLKQHFDPDNIMNPGGTLGLDTADEFRRNFLS